MTIEKIPLADAPKVDAPNRIVFNFPNDHDIGGMSVEIIGVTPEQVAVAVFYLNRSANQIADVRQMQAQGEARTMADIRRELAKGR